MFQTQSTKNRLASPSGRQGNSQMRGGTPSNNQSSNSSKSNKLPKLLNDEKGASESQAVDVGVCSLQGRRPYQEDQFAICRFIKDPTIQADNTPETHFFGVFDGHAGGKCSKAICTTIPYQFCRDEAFPTKVSVALRKAIQRTNEQFLEVAGRMRLNDGSTAVCVVLRGLTMTVSNVGDSRAVLISGKKGIPLTEDHKPSTPSEQKRIASFGGTVTYNTGIARVAGVLAVSRAFGNYSIRNLIRADPDITERELTSQDDFIVLASDGLWDVFTPNEVAEVCSSWSRFGVSRIAEQLVQLALTRGSMDNVTAIVVSLSKYVSRIQQQLQQSQSGGGRGSGGGQSENGSKQRAATASSVLTATSLSRPDSGYGRSKVGGGVNGGSGSLFGDHSGNGGNGNGNGGGGNRNGNGNGSESGRMSNRDDETLIGDDTTITEFDSTLISINMNGNTNGNTNTNTSMNRNRRSQSSSSTSSRAAGSMSRFGSSHHLNEEEEGSNEMGVIQSARSSSMSGIGSGLGSGSGSGDRKLTIVSSSFPPTSSSSDSASFDPTKRPTTQQSYSHSNPMVPLYNNHTPVNNLPSHSVKKSGSNLGNTLPTTTNTNMTNTNTNGSGSSNHNGANPNSQMGGSLFHKSNGTHSKPSPGMDRMHSPITNINRKKILNRPSSSGVDRLGRTILQS